MDDCPLIADHGLVGDQQTAALIVSDGAVETSCGVARTTVISRYSRHLTHTRQVRNRSAGT
ncbi:hypothetical protein [Streptomyces exfoliatus]|uniref:hypothetical protein n=1 Tax=Streptomyces exfoliatus TaxID=1905 RepID=UPI003C2F4C9A